MPAMKVEVQNFPLIFPFDFKGLIGKGGKQGGRASATNIYHLTLVGGASKL